MEKEDTPERPTGVPSKAQWLPGEGVWQLAARDAEGRQEGETVRFRQGGELLSEQDFKAGQAEGRFRRFHPNGELARDGQFHGGVLNGELTLYSSSDAGGESLRSCCVPPGARILRAFYENGLCQLEIFENARGERLLDDGSPCPPLPSHIPKDARFMPEDRHWISGRLSDKGREGSFRCWLEDGSLREEAEYEEGRLCGPFVQYQDGEIVQKSHYERDVQVGAHFRRVVPGTYVDFDIEWEEGNFFRGMRSGMWNLKDAKGVLLRTFDFGAPTFATAQDNDAFTLGAIGRTHFDREVVVADSLKNWAKVATLEGSKALGLVAELRAHWLSKDLEGARAALHRGRLPLAGDTLEQKRKNLLRIKEPDETRSKLLEYLLLGGDPGWVLGRLAASSLETPAAGLDLLNLAEDFFSAPSLDSVRATLLVELGRPEEAEEAARRLVEALGRPATDLLSTVLCTFVRFDFWPGKMEFVAKGSPELPDAVAQDLSAVRRSIGKYALRLAQLRRSILAFGHRADASWLPPDLKELYEGENVTLEDFDLESEEDGEVDIILVREQIFVSSPRLSVRLQQVRRDWLGLCWLCWGAGLDEVALPELLRPRSNFHEALTTAFQRNYRAQDQMQTGGLRSRAQRLPSFFWEERDIASLPSGLAQVAHGDYLEMRAALYFLADGSCLSPFQDDLRV